MTESVRAALSDSAPTPVATQIKTPPRSSRLSKFPLMRLSTENQLHKEVVVEGAAATRNCANTTATQQQLQNSTRRRRGSLRKVALLGRGAHRDKRDIRSLVIDTERVVEAAAALPEPPRYVSVNNTSGCDALGLKVSDIVPQPPIMTFTRRANYTDSLNCPAKSRPLLHGEGDRPHPYNSTTDEEDVLQIGLGADSLRAGLSISSGLDSYYASQGPAQRRRSFQQAKSPLSYSGISSTSLTPETDWDYAETEWWGWVVLTVTWFVFVIGMGSCLEVWSWAWDVGKTPYAPPELEDDPTLPIVGYYPALLILTCVMAWVWVVVAWVGMKYFRHAKISGD